MNPNSKERFWTYIKRLAARKVFLRATKAGKSAVVATYRGGGGGGGWPAGPESPVGRNITKSLDFVLYINI